MVLYIILLEYKCHYLFKETQVNVNLIESIQKNIKLLDENQKYLNKSFKDLKNKLIKDTNKEI